MRQPAGAGACGRPVALLTRAGLLSAQLARWRDGGLTTQFVQRLFQEVATYPSTTTSQNEMDYKARNSRAAPPRSIRAA